MIVRRIARPLLSTIFITGGIDALQNPAAKVAAAAPLLDKGLDMLPLSVTDRIPSEPETLVRINGMVQIAGGVLLAIGKAPRIASLALAASLVPTTVTGHDFWNVADPAQRAAQRTQFFKNVSLLGGLLIAAVDTEGKPSLGWRGRRAAHKAQEAVVAALPHAANDTGHHTVEHLESGLHQVSERARILAGEAAQRSSGLLEVARERGPELAKVARERGTELAEAAREHGPELAKLAREHAGEWAHLAGERGGEWAHLAGERGGEWAHLAGEHAGEWAHSAGEHSEVLAHQARKRAEVALEKARAELSH